MIWCDRARERRRCHERSLRARRYLASGGASAQALPPSVPWPEECALAHQSHRRIFCSPIRRSARGMARKLGAPGEVFGSSDTGPRRLRDRCHHVTPRGHQFSRHPKSSAPDDLPGAAVLGNPRDDRHAENQQQGEHDVHLGLNFAGMNRLGEDRGRDRDRRDRAHLSACGA